MKTLILVSSVLSCPTDDIYAYLTCTKPADYCQKGQTEESSWNPNCLRSAAQRSHAVIVMMAVLGAAGTLMPVTG